jgi:hypothetical protein
MVVAVAIWIIGFFSAPLILYTRKDAMLIKILLLAFSSPPFASHSHMATPTGSWASHLLPFIFLVLVGVYLYVSA